MKKFLLLLCWSLLCISFVNAQNTQVLWSTFSSGAGVSESGNVQLISVIGEELAGVSHSGNILLASGFMGSWYSQSGTTSVNEKPDAMPTAFALEQNYPNPFNPTTTIQFAIPVRSVVAIRIYNILGQLVATLANEEKDAGYHKLMWSGRSDNNAQVSSGVYIYRIEAVAQSDTKQRFVSAKRMLMIK